MSVRREYRVAAHSSYVTEGARRGVGEEMEMTAHHMVVSWLEGLHSLQPALFLSDCTHTHTHTQQGLGLHCRLEITPSQISFPLLLSSISCPFHDVSRVLQSVYLNQISDISILLEKQQDTESQTPPSPYSPVLHSPVPLLLL